MHIFYIIIYFIKVYKNVLPVVNIYLSIEILLFLHFLIII